MNNQDKIINNTEGIFLVDAGAGTGKTYTLVKRYLKILEKGFKPENILLVTFTKKATTEMKIRVRNEAENSGLAEKIGLKHFIEAPIMTFHSFCNKILKIHGRNAPVFLGIRENISANFRLLEEKHYEEKLFTKFYNQFVKRSGKNYDEIIKSVGGNPIVIFKAIKKLSSKGIFPQRIGKEKSFSEKDLERLRGDYEKFSKFFYNMNAEIVRTKVVQNDLYKNISEKIKTNVYIDLPDTEEIFIGKCANHELKEKIFFDDSQEKLIKFICEIYFSYIEYLLKRNFLNFDFMVMFAYLLLKNDANVRAANRFDYIMIDEFQDTDEIQFKLMLMLAKENKSGDANLCGVGDWKQGIYGFRNAAIENIIEFERRLAQYIEELNEDTQRVNYTGEKIERIMLDVNYRSSKEILEASYYTLFTEGKKDEEVSFERAKELFPAALKNAKEFDGKTKIEFYIGEDRNAERKIILDKIKELVNSEVNYVVEFDKKLKVNSKRKIDFKDICILSRDKSFGLELQREALKNNIPMNYEGGLEIFSTQHGILILAWLKLLLWKNDTTAWVPVLEAEKYSHNEIFKIIRGVQGKDKKEDKFTYEKIDERILDFLDELKNKESVLLQAEAVLKKYNLVDEIGNRLITIISELMAADFISLNELVKTMEDSARLEYDIELINTENAVSVMTIHKSKGLEFPVVILANCNQSVFPSTKTDTDSIIFDDVIGLRNKKVFGESGGYKYVYNNWHTDLSLCVTKKSEYDEERRLFYVAATRAKQYLYFTASRPSQFFKGLAEANSKEAVENFIYNGELASTDKVRRRDEGIALRGVSKPAAGDFEERDVTEHEINFRRYAKRLASGIDILPELKHENDELKGLILRFDELLYEIKKEARDITIDAEFHFPTKNGVNYGLIELLAHYEDGLEVIIFGDEEQDAQKLEFYIYAIENLHKTKNVKGRIFELK